MAEYMSNWVNALPLSEHVDTVDEQFSNLALFAEVLEHFKLAPAGTARSFSKKYGQNAKLQNARMLRRLLIKAELPIGRKSFQGILTEERGAAVRLLFKIKCKVDPQGVTVDASHKPGSGDGASKISHGRTDDSERRPKFNLEDPKDALVKANNVNTNDLNLQLHLDPFFQHMRRSYEKAEQDELDEEEFVKQQRMRNIHEKRRQRHERQQLAKQEEARGHEDWVNVQRVTVARERRELSFEMAMQQRRQFRQKATYDAHVKEMTWGIDDYERNLKRLGIEMDEDETADGEPAAEHNGSLSDTNECDDDDSDELNGGAYKERMQVAMTDFSKVIREETKSYMDRIKSRLATHTESRKEREQRRHNVLVEQEASRHGIQVTREQAELMARIRQEAANERASAQQAQLQRHQTKQKRQRQTEALQLAKEVRAQKYDDVLIRAHERGTMQQEEDAEALAETNAQRSAVLAAKRELKHERAVGVAKAAVRGLIDVVLFTAHFRSNVASLSVPQPAIHNENKHPPGDHSSVSRKMQVKDTDPVALTREVRMIDPTQLLMPPQMWRRAMRRYVRGVPVTMPAWEDEKLKQDAEQVLQGYNDMHDYLNFSGDWDLQDEMPDATTDTGTTQRTPLEQAFDVLDAVATDKFGIAPSCAPGFKAAPFGYNLALIGPPQSSKSSLATLLAFRHGFHVISITNLLQVALESSRTNKGRRKSVSKNVRSSSRDVGEAEGIDDALKMEEEELLATVGAAVAEAIENDQHPLYEVADSIDVAKLCVVRLKQHLASTEAHRPWLLDGLPRNALQAQYIDAALAGKFAVANKVPAELTVDQFLQKTAKGQFKVPDHRGNAIADARARLAEAEEEQAVKANGGKPLSKAEKRALPSHNPDAEVPVPEVDVLSQSNFFKVYVLPESTTLCADNESGEDIADVGQQEDSEDSEQQLLDPPQLESKVWFNGNDLELQPCPPSLQAAKQQEESSTQSETDAALGASATELEAGNSAAVSAETKWIPVDWERMKESWKTQEPALADWLNSLCCLVSAAEGTTGGGDEQSARDSNDGDVRTRMLEQLASLVCSGMNEFQVENNEPPTVDDTQENNPTTTSPTTSVCQTTPPEHTELVQSLSWYHALATHKFGCGKPVDSERLGRLAEQFLITQKHAYESCISTELAALRNLQSEAVTLGDALARASLRAIYDYPQHVTVTLNMEGEVLVNNGFIVPAAESVQVVLQRIANSTHPEAAASKPKQVERRMWRVIEEHVFRIEHMLDSWQNETDMLYSNLFTKIVERCVALIDLEEQYHIGLRDTVSAVYEVAASVVASAANPVFITVPPTPPRPPADLTLPLTQLPEALHGIPALSKLREALARTSNVAHDTRQAFQTGTANVNAESSAVAQALGLLASEFEKRQETICIQACSIIGETWLSVQDTIAEARQWLKKFTLGRDRRLRTQLENNQAMFQSNASLKRVASGLCDVPIRSIYAVAAQDDVCPRVLDAEAVLDTRGGELRFTPVQLLTLVLSIKEGGPEKPAPGDDTFLLRRRSAQPRFVTVSSRQMLHALQVCQDSNVGAPAEWQHIADNEGASTMLGNVAVIPQPRNEIASRGRPMRRLSGDRAAESSSIELGADKRVLGKSHSDPQSKYPRHVLTRNLPLYRIAHAFACGIVPRLPTMTDLLDMRKSFANADAKLDWRLSEAEFLSVGLWFHKHPAANPTIAGGGVGGSGGSQNSSTQGKTRVLSAEEASTLSVMYWSAFVCEDEMLDYRHFLLGLCFDPRFSSTDPRKGVGLFKAFALCSAFDAFTQGTAAELDGWTWHPKELRLSYRNLVMLLECGGMVGKGAEVLAAAVFAKCGRNVETEGVSFDELVTSDAWRDKYFAASSKGGSSNAVVQPYVLGDPYATLRFANC